jgi:alpha-D-ribose 1-methylphosphonate 5-triphosphate synthase subunit PhnH
MNTDICLPGVRGLRPGFSDPVMESQGTFRTVLNAMINPGRVLSAGGSLKAPEPLHPAAAAVCLTLLDFETPLWVDLPGGSESMRWLQFHCGCPLIPHPSAAKFALITNWTDAPSLGEFYIGKDESPGSSATLILQVSGLTSGSGRRLAGPGIETESFLAVEGLPDHFWTFWKANHRLYPLGVDIIFTAGSVLAALPRTIEVE